MSIPSLLLLAALLDDQPYVNAAFGIRLPLPPGWTRHELVAGQQSLHVVFAPPEGATLRQLSLRVTPGAPADAERLRALSETAVAADPSYDNARRVDLGVAGRQVPGLLIDAHVAGQHLLLRQAYLVEHGIPFTVQDFLPADDPPETLAGFDAIWGALEFTGLSPEQAERRALEALAARCGSEIAWADSWEDAATRARAERRPILVAARMYPGFVISDERMIGPFMDEDIVALIAERYVALDVGQQDLASLPFHRPEIYGLGPQTFGQAALIVTPEGRVLAESAFVLDEFLRAGLGLEAPLPGPPPAELAAPGGAEAGDPEAPGDGAGAGDPGAPADGAGGSDRGAATDRALPTDRAAQAQRLYRRGELAELLALLATPATVGEQLLVARSLMRLRRCEEAGAALARARELPGADALAVDLDLEAAGLSILTGEDEHAIALLEGVLAAAPDHPRVPEALLARGRVAHLHEGPDAGEVWLRRILDEHGSTRWAWAAAGQLTSTGWRAGRASVLSLPDEQQWELLRQPEYEPLPGAAARRAARDALAYVLAHQQPDGSWLALSELGQADDTPPHDFELAVTAICAAGLLPHRGDPAVDGAIERALDWLLTAYAQVLAADEPATYMDYSVWSRAYVLEFLAAAVEAGFREGDALAGVVAQLVGELAARQKPGGGWSYYVTGDLEDRASPTAQAMSFTTAAIVLALLAARDVGFDVPAPMLAGGLDTLERARVGDVFAYMVSPTDVAAAEPLGRAGAAGRGPVCALALLSGGRAEVEDLRTALSVFVELRSTLAAELGKHLMHTGAEAQGSHYLLFDIRTAAAAVAALPAGEQAAFRPAVLEELLRARTSQGTYVDNPINGRAFGAGMALLAFHDLGVDVD